jgi:hypothetical protein
MKYLTALALVMAIALAVYAIATFNKHHDHILREMMEEAQPPIHFEYIPPRK